MVYSDTTNKSGVLQNIETMCDLGDGYISGSTDELRKFNAIINRVYQRVWHIIYDTAGNWKFDDGNYDTLPFSLTHIVEGQRRYALPPEALGIERVEVKDADGNWYVVHPITQKTIRGEGIDDFMDDNGRLMYYRLIGDVIEFFAPADYSQDDSLKIYHSRDMVKFDYDDTSASLKFASPYHQIVPLKASIEWLKIKQPTSPSLQLFREDELKIEMDLRKHYATRFKDYPPRIIREKTSFR